MVACIGCCYTVAKVLVIAECGYVIAMVFLVCALTRVLLGGDKQQYNILVWLGSYAKIHVFEFCFSFCFIIHLILSMKNNSSVMTTLGVIGMVMALTMLYV